MATYHPEPYWSRVAQSIQTRSGVNVVAGDDTPYYRYKRQRFLALLNQVSFEGKTVVEIGSGPGGNLLHIQGKKPKKLIGVDISEDMISLASSRLGDTVSFIKTDGKTIDLKDKHADVVFSATVLQHNTDLVMLESTLREMCRISGDDLVLFERIEAKQKGNELCLGHPVSYYREICKKEGFELDSSDFINIQVSYIVCGIIARLFDAPNRVEGEPMNGFATFLQKAALVITKPLDRVFIAKRDLGKLHFKRKK